MRLIDADKLIGFIDVGHLRNSSESSYSEVDLVNMVNSMPTAYNVDKIIEQLEELKDINVCVNISCIWCKYNAECKTGEMSDKVAIDRAIEIVEEGGVIDE